MASTVSGKISEIIFAHFEPGEDLRQGLMAVIKERDIKSGVVLSVTGALERATLQRASGVGEPTIPLELIEVQNGTYLGEDDIIRFDDDFGR